MKKNIKKDSTDIDLRKLSNEKANMITKNSLKDALLHLLLEKSFEKISITEIVKYANVSRVSFYRNYNSKEELLCDVYNEIAKNLRRVFSSKRYQNNIYKLFFDFFTFIKRNRYKLLLSSHIQMLFKNLLSDKVFSADSIEEEYEIMLFSGAFHFIVTKWIDNNFTESVEFMATFCSKNFDYKWLGKIG